MPFRTAISSENPGQPRQNYRFFILPTALTVTANERCLELQQDIQKYEEYISELLHRKEPIEHDIKEQTIYEEKVNSELIKIKAEIAESETKISYTLCPMTEPPSEASRLAKTVYVNSTTRECMVVKSNQKSVASFHLRKENLDLSNLNTPGLKSEILGLILQKGIMNAPILQEKLLEIKRQHIRYEEYAAERQKTEDTIIDLNQKLNDICKKMDDAKDVLNQLQEELTTAQENERLFTRPAPAA